MEKLITDVSVFFSNGITKIQNQIAARCKDLNLQESQVVRREFFGHLDISIPNSEVIIKGAHHPAGTKRVKKDGVGGKIARGLGKFAAWWG